MPEPRDRLARPFDIADAFVHGRRSGVLGVLVDQPQTGLNPFGSPIQQRTTPMAGTRGLVGFGAMRGVGIGRGGFRTPRTGNGRARSFYGSPAFGRQNATAGSGRRGRGRLTNSVLPSWYPRTPLRDITAVVRAIERRRLRSREVEGQEIESPMGHLDSSVSTSGAPLEHSVSVVTPNSRIRQKPYPPSALKVPKILLDITNQTAGDSDFLTPQKKLLNSIDTVEKVVMEELQKLKRTPTAKKAEREKKVRTLMSMR